MKILVYDWEAWNRDDLYEVLKRMGINFSLFSWNFKAKGHDKNDDKEFEEWFEKTQNTSSYDCVFSINYWPPISNACKNKGIKYISWSYDSPIDIQRPEETFGNKCNYIFLYDRYEAEKYQGQGFQNVYHMPLSVNYDRLSKYDYFKKECDKYRTDISFVGGLYNSLFGDILNVLDEETQSILLKIIETQMNMPAGNYILDQLITGNFSELVSSQVTAVIKGLSPVTARQIEFIINEEITRRERIILLNLLGKRYKTDLYSGQTFDVLNNVNQRSTVDYKTEMPIVFAASKINLNPALTAIRSGVSLRAYDVMACGGFLLTNYKDEYEELFKVGKELIVYTSIPDAVEKAEYYLSHEDERLAIAKAGRLRIKTDYRMEYRISEMFKIVGV